MSPVPRVSWPEVAEPDLELRAVDQICTLLAAGLPPLGPACSTLYFAVSTPAPYDTAHAALLAALPAGLRVTSLAWPPHGRCYVAEGLDAWRILLPLVFRLGPPELTLLALHAQWGIHAPEESLLQSLQASLANKPSAGVAAYAGLHFDSGDLRDRF